MPSCDRLMSLGGMSSGFAHVIACDRISVFNG